MPTSSPSAALDDSSTKYLDHRIQATERNVVEGAFIIESTFEHDRMKMWVPSKHVAEGLMGDHGTGHQFGSGRFAIEILYKPVDQAGHFGEQKRPLLTTRCLRGPVQR